MVAPEVAPQQPGSAPQQFSVRALLVLMTLAGVAVMLISTLRIFGGVILMLIATAATQIVFRGNLGAALPPPGSAASRPRLWVDLLWGVAIPLMCLLLDPVVLRDNLLTLETSFTNFVAQRAGSEQNWIFAGTLEFYSLPAYTLIAVQMLLLLIKFFGPAPKGRTAAVLGGALFSGGLFASFTAVILAMPATVGVLFAGVGLLGFSPVGVAFVYFPHGLDCYKHSRRMISRLQTNLYFATGMVCGIAVPLAIGCLLEWWRQSVLD